MLVTVSDRIARPEAVFVRFVLSSVELSSVYTTCLQELISTSNFNFF